MYIAVYLPNFMLKLHSF